MNRFFSLGFFSLFLLHTGFPVMLTSDMALLSFDAVLVRREQIIRYDLFIVHIIYV